MKFEELTELYFMSIKASSANGTYYNKKNAIYTHVLPYFKGMNIDAIRPYDIEKWHMTMYNKKYLKNSKKGEYKNLSAVYLHDMHSYLSQIFTYGCTFFDLKENPAMICGNFKTQGSFRKRTTGDQFFTLQEFKKFISVVDNEYYYLLFNVLYFTGMRLGEMKAMKWINFNNSYFTVINSYDRTPNLNGKAGLKDTKNPYGHRQILIPPKLNSLLLQYQDDIRKEHGYSDDWFIFGGKKPTSSTTIRYHKDKYCEAAGIKKIHLNGFRHSHASLLINSDKNVSILTIANRLGHKDANRVLNTYAHIFPEQELELSKILCDSESFIE